MKVANNIRPYSHFKFPNEITIEAKVMTENECKWHNVSEGSYEIRCKNYGWFPTEILMGTIKGRFADTYNIGANIGGNMGTAGMCVVNIESAKKMLNNAGYYNIIMG